MSAITQSYKIDMTSGAVPLRIKVSQYDAGIRTLTFALFNLGAKLTSAQLSSLTAYVQGTKQDKKGFEYACTADFNADGCYVAVEISEQMTACAGDVVCELVLVAGDDRIGSANFILEVERAALGADTDISETELPDIITAGRQYAAQAEDAAERAEEAAAGVDNYALAGAGMMTEYSAGVIDTNIYLHREPKIGDRLLIMFTQTFTENTPIKIYKENGGTAYTLNFDMWSTAFVLKGLCLVEVVDFLDNFALRWLHSYSGTDYQAGQYIGINGNYINNIAPQLGDNSEYHEKDSAITDGNLGTYGYYAKYIIINFKARAVPNDTTGKYSLQLSKGATLEDASLVDRDGNDFTAPIKTGVILLCSVDNSNDIVTVLNNDIMANGDIIDGQGNTLSVLAEALTKTASGNPVVITDCAGGKARSLKTTIEPIQDLHGLPFPYVGGAYKNKLPLTVDSIKEAAGAGWNDDNEKIINGVKYTIVTDAANNVIGIKADGTASVLSQFRFAKGMTVTTGQIGSLMASSVNGVSFTLWKNNDADNVARIYSGDVTINENVSEVSAYIGIAGGLHVDNLMLYPMIRDASAPSGFAPWENKCPISGRTEARVDTENEDSSESAYAVIQLGTTVYGGEVDFDTGVCTVTHQRINAKTLTWTLTAYNTMYTSDLSELAVKPERATVLCNILPYKNITTGNGEDNVVFWGGTINESNGNLCMKCTSIATNIGAWTYYINHNDVYICYKLAEPITIQLTPTQLQMLKGYNRVTIDSGSIEVGYISKIS